MRMLLPHKVFPLLAIIPLTLTALACNGNGNEPQAGKEPVLLSVAPEGGATGVSLDSPVIMGFSQPMMAGADEYADVHEGGVDGALVPGKWHWSKGNTRLTFTPEHSWQPGTSYVVHVGAGMQGRDGEYINCAEYGPAMGGQWMTEQMLEGGQHGYGMNGGGGMMGGGYGMGGTGWTRPGSGSGSYGMMFSFTTQ